MLPYQGNPYAKKGMLEKSRSYREAGLRIGGGAGGRIGSFGGNSGRIVCRF